MAQVRTCNSVAAFFPFLFDMTQFHARNARKVTFTSPRAVWTFGRVDVVPKLRSLQEVTEELRSNPEGNAAWQRALQRRAEAKNEAMAQNRLSKVRFYRLQRGLTQRELAQAMATKQSNISRYERPSYKASRNTLEKLAVALRVGVADLV